MVKVLHEFYLSSVSIYAVCSNKYGILLRISSEQANLYDKDYGVQMRYVREATPTDEFRALVRFQMIQEAFDKSCKYILSHIYEFGKIYLRYESWRTWQQASV